MNDVTSFVIKILPTILFIFSGFDDILERDLLFNSVSVEPDPLLGQTPVHALGPSMQSSSRAVDMLEIPGNY